MWAKTLIEKRDAMFNKKVDHIYFFYRENQPIYDALRKELGETITFLQQMCTMSFLRDTCSLHDNSLIFIDDLMFECTADTAEIYTIGATRYHTNVVMLCQNLFERSNPALRTISLNTRYFNLVRNARDRSTVGNLAKQVFPYKSRFLVEAFKDATRMPYSYLFLDLTQECPDSLRVRANIFGENNEPVKVYLPKEDI